MLRTKIKHFSANLSWNLISPHQLTIGIDNRKNTNEQVISLREVTSRQGSMSIRSWEIGSKSAPCLDLWEICHFCIQIALQFCISPCNTQHLHQQFELIGHNIYWPEAALQKGYIQAAYPAPPIPPTPGYIVCITYRLHTLPLQFLLPLEPVKVGWLRN